LGNWTAIALVFGATILGVAFFFSRFNPLWSAIERWPRTLERQDLTAKFDGMIRFSNPGSRLDLCEVNSHDVLSFIKRTPAGESGLVLRICARALPVDLGEILVSHASLAFPASSELVPEAVAGEFRIKYSSPGALEALTRAVAEALEHPPGSRYRASTTGPTDDDAINEYFGLNTPSA
jgi:hypothetical protein